MLIEDLPEDIKVVALEYKKLHTYQPGDPYLDPNEADDLNHAFVWDRTKEGGAIWYDVNNSRFERFYEFHAPINSVKAVLEEKLNILIS